jgi:predicted metal-dependent RNase
MLLGGPSVKYLEQIASDPNSHVVLTSYQAPETPGRAILEGARKVLVNNHEITIACAIDRLDGFASHSNYDQLMQYVFRLRPKLRRILVNHGERAKAQSFASSLNKIYKIQTQHPLVQEAVRLL